MLSLILGVIIGFALACCGMVRKIVGKLSYVVDDGELYFYMQLDDDDPGSILTKRYVILEVDSKPTQN